ncbi:MAG: crosslink repair DNA glycosylase YcaQ family protein [Anaerolineae bacterium]|nr:crosslink repair DNA glycosylase YcaQ family protein [Anaerolineae bacterium]
MLVVDPARVEALRELRGRRRPELRVQSEEQALEFVNEVGFCFLFTARGFAMPTLWEAICGEARSLPLHHDDRDLGKAWSWKDSLPARKACFYGKVLRKTPTLLSLAFLPHVYALSPNYGSEDDYLEEYEQGKLTAEAKWVYEALLRGGPQSTTRLRKMAGLEGKANCMRFDRAVTELQAGLKIVKVGISDANAWGYCYVYDLVLRQYPWLAEKARAISSAAAEDALCLKYLEATACVTPAEVSRLFGWEPWRMERLLTRLCASGRVVADARLPGSSEAHLVRTEDVPLVRAE